MLSNLKLIQLARNSVKKFEEKAQAATNLEQKASYLRCAEKASELALKVSASPQLSIEQFSALPERRELEVERLLRSGSGNE